MKKRTYSFPIGKELAVVRGAPESFLRWIAKSTRKLAAEPGRQGYKVGD